VPVGKLRRAHFLSVLLMELTFSAAILTTFAEAGLKILAGDFKTDEFAAAPVSPEKKAPSTPCCLGRWLRLTIPPSRFNVTDNTHWLGLQRVILNSSKSRLDLSQNAPDAGRSSRLTRGKYNPSACLSSNSTAFAILRLPGRFRIGIDSNHNGYHIQPQGLKR